MQLLSSSENKLCIFGGCIAIPITSRATTLELFNRKGRGASNTLFQRSNSALDFRSFFKTVPPFKRYDLLDNYIFGYL